MTIDVYESQFSWGWLVFIGRDAYALDPIRKLVFHIGFARNGRGTLVRVGDSIMVMQPQVFKICCVDGRVRTQWPDHLDYGLSEHVHVNRIKEYHVQKE